MSILCQLRKEQLFTSSEMEVVNYIVTHPKTAVKATIRELAELTYSSPSTIGRVCKKVGVEGFTELKIKLATELDRLVVESKNADVNIPVGPEDRVEDFPRIFFNLHYQALSDAYHTVDIKVLKRGRRFVPGGCGVCSGIPAVSGSGHGFSVQDGKAGTSLF